MTAYRLHIRKKCLCKRRHLMSLKSEFSVRYVLQRFSRKGSSRKRVPPYDIERKRHFVECVSFIFVHYIMIISKYMIM